MPNTASKYSPILALLILLATSAALYSPWIHNPLIFDDPNLFKSPALSDYAINPFSLYPRQFPYFTLGFEQIASDGDLKISRISTLLLHGINGFLLFILTQQLLTKFTHPLKRDIICTCICLIFITHPIYVYAVGYLIQRTIIFANFFLLLSSIQFIHALKNNSWRRAIFAGIVYSMAALSKEHAITGFVAIAGLAFIQKPSENRNTRQIFLFLCASLPIAIWIALCKTGYIGATYEPDAINIINSEEVFNSNSKQENWALSAIMQCKFYFHYLAYMIWPDPAYMSIDIRPDFTKIRQSSLLPFFPIALATLIGLTCHHLLSKNKNPSTELVCYGFFASICLFTVELSTIRFQEPIVLYRAYLFTPPLFLALAGIATLLSTRQFLAFSLIIITALLPIATNRLDKFSSNLALWDEAVQKLPSEYVTGANRVFFNRANQYLKNNKPELALHDADMVVKISKDLMQGYFMKGLIYLKMRNNAEALQQFDLALQRTNDKTLYGVLEFDRGIALEAMGRDNDAVLAYTLSANVGYPLAKYRLQAKEKRHP